VEIEMKKIMFLAIAGIGFFGLDANAGIFNKKSKTCSNGSCSSSQTSRVRTVVAAPSKAQAPTAPQKKVEAPSPVKAQESKPGQAPAPVKAPSKKVAAPQQ
jgi:hypothetical protein